MGKRTWMALALSLALLAGCGYRTMPAQGEEPAPGGASSAVETAPGGETEVHPQPLEVKDHIPPAAVAGELLPDVGFKAAAGDGCVHNNGGMLRRPGVGRGKAEELSAFGALLPQ